MTPDAEGLLKGDSFANDSDKLRSFDDARPSRSNRFRSDAPAAAPSDLGFASKRADRDEAATFAQTLQERSKPQRGDIDGNGTINILDALALARAVEAGEQPGAARNEWDMNSDGRIDASDVSAIAIASVSLGQQPAKGGA